MFVVYSDSIEIVSFYLSHHPIMKSYIGDITVNGNIYFYWNYSCPFPWKSWFFQLELFSLIRNSKYTSDCLEAVLLFHCFMGPTVFFSCSKHSETPCTMGRIVPSILKHPVLCGRGVRLHECPVSGNKQELNLGIF